MQLYLGFETVSYLLLQRMASIEIDVLILCPQKLPKKYYG